MSVGRFIDGVILTSQFFKLPVNFKYLTVYFLHTLGQCTGTGFLLQLLLVAFVFPLLGCHHRFCILQICLSWDTWNLNLGCLLCRLNGLFSSWPYLSAYNLLHSAFVLIGSYCAAEHCTAHPTGRSHDISRIGRIFLCFLFLLSSALLNYIRSVVVAFRVINELEPGIKYIPQFPHFHSSALSFGAGYIYTVASSF